MLLADPVGVSLQEWVIVLADVVLGSDFVVPVQLIEAGNPLRCALGAILVVAFGRRAYLCIHTKDCAEN